MNGRRKAIAAVLVAAAAIVYGLSPLDIPELLTGPLGLTDDLAVFAGAGLAVWKLLSSRKQNPGSATPPAA
jgi:uncharacterized membrane protein YkvA (DUF1232 family)